jgi:stearoyl-CoA desaturase (delta-9 desaturase)
MPVAGDQVSTEVREISEPQRLNWPTTIVMALLHLGALAALFTFSWRALAVAIFFYWMCTGLGISMGYHRLLTHRSYKAPRLLEYFFAVCGALTLEGGPFRGLLHIESTIRNRISTATRILPAMAPGGLM